MSRASARLDGASIDLALHEAGGRRAESHELLRRLPSDLQTAAVRRAAALLAQARPAGPGPPEGGWLRREGERLFLRTPEGGEVALPPHTVVGSPGGLGPRQRALVDRLAGAASREGDLFGRLVAALTLARTMPYHSDREQADAAVEAVSRLVSARERAVLAHEAVAVLRLTQSGLGPRPGAPVRPRGWEGTSLARAMAEAREAGGPAVRDFYDERAKEPDPAALHSGARAAELQALEHFDQAEGYARTLREFRARLNEANRAGAPVAELNRLFGTITDYQRSVDALLRDGDMEARRAGERYARLAALYPGWTPPPGTAVALRAPREPAAGQRTAQAIHEWMVQTTLMIPMAAPLALPTPAPAGRGTAVKAWAGALTAAEAAAIEAASLRAAAAQAARTEAVVSSAAAARASAARASVARMIEATAAKAAAARAVGQAGATLTAAESQAARGASAAAEAMRAAGRAEMEAAKTLEARAVAAQAEALKTARAQAVAARYWASQTTGPRAAEAGSAAAMAESAAADALALSKGHIPAVRGATGQIILLPPGSVTQLDQGPRFLRLVDIGRAAAPISGPLADRIAAALRATRAQAGFTAEEAAKAAMMAVHQAGDGATRAAVEREAAVALGLFEPSKMRPLTRSESQTFAFAKALGAVQAEELAGRTALIERGLAMQTALTREAALSRLRAQGAAAAAAGGEAGLLAAMREASRSAVLSPSRQFRIAIEAAQRSADPAMAARLRDALASFEAGRPVDAAILDLWGRAGGGRLPATPALPPGMAPAVPAAPVPGRAAAPAPPTSEQLRRMLAPSERPAALTPWATLRTESQTLRAMSAQEAASAQAGNPERMVFEAMRRMVGTPNLTHEERFRAAVEAAYAVMDEAARARIRAEMAARNVGRPAGLSFPLLRLWREAGGGAIPTTLGPAPAAAPPLPVAPALPTAPAGAAPRPTFSPFGVSLPYGIQFPSSGGAPFGLTGAARGPLAAASWAA